MIQLTEKQITETVANMRQVAALLGYRLDNVKIAPLPSSPKGGQIFYWKGTLNDKPAGTTVGADDLATATNLMTMLVHSIAFIIVMGNRPERELLAQALSVWNYHHTDLFTAVFVSKTVDAIDAIPITKELPTAEKIWEQSMAQLRGDAIKSIETMRQIAIFERRRGITPEPGMRVHAPLPMPEEKEEKKDEEKHGDQDADPVLH